MSPRFVDIALTVGLAIWAMPDLPWPWRPPGHVPPLAESSAIVGLFLLQTLPFLWRRRLPGAVLCTSLVALTGRRVMGLDVISAIVAAYAGAYAAGRFGDRWTLLAGRALAGASVVAGVIEFARLPREAALPFVMYAAMFLVGEGERRRHEAFASALAQEGAAERFRIARELHDLLAHKLSLIALHAGAARLIVRDDPNRAVDAIQTVETTARDAADELSTLLGVLRDDQRDAAPRAPLAPQPAMSNLRLLIERAQAAGLPVGLSVEGNPESIPASVQVSAHRIVQEALTNVVKHAGVARTEVRIRCEPTTLFLEITDEGAGSTARGQTRGISHQLLRSSEARSGRGLVGMVERVSSHGGVIQAGPRREQGFVVRATIPLRQPS